MKRTVTSLIIVLCLLHGTSLKAQNCDPWIKQIYNELYGRTPNGTECNIVNYNYGSWGSYEELKGLIRSYNSSKTPAAVSTPAVRVTAWGNCNGAGYNGLCSIAQFDNDDFPIRKTSCGQGALVTALWQAGLSSVYQPKELVKSLWDYAPPKVSVAGLSTDGYGSDWHQINYGLDGYKSQGINYNWQKGIPALQNELRKKVPCIIMLDTGTFKEYSYAWLTGHWVVAYGYDANYLYVTNFPDNRMTWDQLKKGWGGVWNEGHMAKLHGTAEMFAAVWKQ